MAVTIDGSTRNGEPWVYMFKSSDVKPTTINDEGDPVPTNALGIELDTGKIYYFSDGAWNTFGGA